ncbi:beta-propeller domain-containing protein [Ilumatobacter sp.]|uniref:beta-propeller domain-containing protein n=1 Tax=Ilumatobacter sp. TaxID=1967498 RepID=UPI003B52C2BB
MIPTRPRTTIAIATVAATLAVAACSATAPDGGDAGGAPGTGVVTSSGGGSTDRDPTDRRTPTATAVSGSGDRPAGFAGIALRRFDRCDAVLDHLHHEAAERVGAYGFGDGGWYGRTTVGTDAMADSTVGGRAADDAMAESADAMDAPAAEGSGGASGTNIQVEGVDEADIVKTDGELIVALADDRLHVVDVAGRTELGSVGLGEGESRWVRRREMFLAPDRAVVVSHGEGGFIEPMPIEADSASSMPVPSRPSTTVTEVDLSDPASPTVVATLEIEGRYLSARAVDGTMRLAVTAPPAPLPFVYPSGPEAEEFAAEANRRLVAETTIDDWIPGWSLIGPDDRRSEGELVECDRVHAPAEFAGFDVLSVVTIPLDAPLAAPGSTTAVLASGDTVYASRDRMYVATQRWQPPAPEADGRIVAEGGDTTTEIHRFGLGAGQPAEYEASGSVSGRLLNQFSMHDDGETFFAALTEGDPWSGRSSESRVVALARSGEVLTEIGSVGELGRGEQIFSVRYVDDVAYVVTFRQTDPFYVVDLSDPTAMAVTGELKIPGVSNYLHPLGDSLVLGVGRDATDDGRVTGSKMSLFDVADPANPIELDVWTAPGASSDVEFDHRAFLWWADSDTAVVPLTSWSDGFSGAVVVDVTRDGIVERGRITHADSTTGEFGATDCRVLDESGLTEADGALFSYAQEGQINLCTSDQRGGAEGHSCERIAVEDIPNYVDPDQISTVIDLDGIDRVEMCWPGGGIDDRIVIRRSMVIDGELWTLSTAKLRADELATLAPIADVELR